MASYKFGPACLLRKLQIEKLEYQQQWRHNSYKQSKIVIAFGPFRMVFGGSGDPLEWFLGVWGSFRMVSQGVWGSFRMVFGGSGDPLEWFLGVWGSFRMVLGGLGIL